MFPSPDLPALGQSPPPPPMFGGQNVPGRNTPLPGSAPLKKPRSAQSQQLGSPENPVIPPPTVVPPTPTTRQGMGR